MGKIHSVTPVNLILGMLSGEVILFEMVERGLEEKYGPIELKSPILPFTYTDYYEKEMGKDIKRQFLSFQRLIDPGALASIKIYTNTLEEEFQKEKATSGRPINLDPGYLAAGKLVLASTKDYCHRVYLGEGIYGEVTSRYTGGVFEPLPWTYPDYCSKEYMDFFKEIRALYMEKLRNQIISKQTIRGCLNGEDISNP